MLKERYSEAILQRIYLQGKIMNSAFVRLQAVVVAIAVGHHGPQIAGHFFSEAYPFVAAADRIDDAGSGSGLRLGRVRRNAIASREPCVLQRGFRVTE